MFGFKDTPDPTIFMMCGEIRQSREVGESGHSKASVRLRSGLITIGCHHITVEAAKHIMNRYFGEFEKDKPKIVDL